MRLFTNLLFKVTVSSMILTAPAMIDGRTNAGGMWLDKKTDMPFASANVIKNYIDHMTVWPVHAYVDKQSMVAVFGAPTTALAGPTAAAKAIGAAAAEATGTAATPATAVTANAVKEVVRTAERIATPAEMKLGATSASFARAAALRRVIRESNILYTAIGLEKEGLSEEAFEYAWRGYHNLLKRGSIRRKSVLSIADFSQSSSEKRMYVIDIRHRRLLFRTYVAHGQNSGAEFAESFSNEPESFKSSLGFYVTKKTYVGRNGLSLRLNGVDPGFNDKAMKRNIVLHGCSYVGDRYLESFGETGTSLGCPALPSSISRPIIQKVKNGSCFFIYHPTEDYLDHSVVINE
ncbi:MAG TPA: murein L,D-transpeptidase catalytic domain family protein [Puia sp.]|nr:murein L,D-transpeptidase catalytic domain family protein [Puia sp.]